MINYPYPSIAKFADLVQLKDYRPPTKKEYVRYLLRLADHLRRDPASATEDDLRRYYLFLRQQKHFGGSAMKVPDGLERKYPKAGEEWPWFWFWPDDHLSRDPRSSLQRRHHLSDWEFLRKIKEAGSKARFNKRVTPHVLRHSFATQLVDGNCDIRTLQELLGHKSVETTMIYTHVMKRPVLGVKSPLDSL